MARTKDEFPDPKIHTYLRRFGQFRAIFRAWIVDHAGLPDNSRILGESVSRHGGRRAGAIGLIPAEHVQGPRNRSLDADEICPARALHRSWYCYPTFGYALPAQTCPVGHRLAGFPVYDYGGGIETPDGCFFRNFQSLISRPISAAFRA